MVGPEGLFGWGPFGDFGDALQSAGYTPEDCKLLPNKGPDGEPQYKFKTPGPHFIIENALGLWRITVKFFSDGGVTGTAEDMKNPGRVLNIHDADTDTNWFQGIARRA